MKTLNKIAIALVLMASATFAQVTLSSTTLGAAVTTGSNGIAPTTITLASTSTMLNAGPQGQINTALYVDKELMYVVTVVDSTHVTVQRGKGGGAGGVVANHATLAPVLFSITSGPTAAPNYFSSVQTNAETNGACTSTSLLVLPRVYVYSGDIFQCLGSQWVQVDRPGRAVVVAAAAAPTGLLTLTGTAMVLSGTNAVTGITVPAGFASGMSITIMPTGAFTWTTATNIALAGTAVVGKALVFTWNAGTSKWYPSYIA